MGDLEVLGMEIQWDGKENSQELVHLEEERGVKDDVQVLGFDHQVDGSGSPETDNGGEL